MTQMPHSPNGDNRAGGPSNPGPKTDSFSQVLAELRDISQQVGNAEPPPVSFPPRPTDRRLARGRVRFDQSAKTGPKWPVRLAAGGGILLVTGLLAVPVRDALFNRRATSEPLASQALAEARVPPSTERVVTTTSALSVATRDTGESARPAPVPAKPAQEIVAAPALPPKPRIEAEVVLPPVRLPEPLNLADVRPAPAPERAPAPVEASKPEVASVPLVQPPRPAPEPSTGTQVAALSDVPIVSNAKAPPPPPADASANALLSRAQEMIRMRDISSARLLLERLLQTGSAQAAFALAETYDPQVLAQWKVRGLIGDAAKAKEFYALASERGDPKAGERIQALK